MATAPPTDQPSSFSFIPVNLDVLRAAADADDVGFAVAVEVGANHIFGAEAFVIKHLLFPLRPGRVERMEEVNDGVIDFAFGHAAEADDQGIYAGAGQIGRPDGMAPFVVFDEHLSLPELAGFVGLGVNDSLMAVPGFNCGEVAFAARESPDFYFARAVFFRVAFAKLLLGPL